MDRPANFVILASIANLKVGVGFTPRELFKAGLILLLGHLLSVLALAQDAQQRLRVLSAELYSCLPPGFHSSSTELALKLVAHGERDSINQQYKGQRALSSRMWTAFYHIVNMQYICSCVLPS